MLLIDLFIDSEFPPADRLDNSQSATEWKVCSLFLCEVEVVLFKYILIYGVLWSEGYFGCKFKV